MPQKYKRVLAQNTPKKLRRTSQGLCLETAAVRYERIIGVDGDRFVKKKSLIAIVIVLAIVAGALFVTSLNNPEPPLFGDIVTSEWEFSTSLGGSIYNETVYGHRSLAFNVSSEIGSEVYMLSLKTTESPMTSSSLIRSSVSSCKIDWGWLGFSNNYAFLTWNGTCWIADTNNGSAIPETTIIAGYDPSTSWRKVGIEVASTGIKYYVDDQLVATHTNRIPDGDFQFYGEFKSSGTASKLYIASHNS
jgi:hypothetical protein